MCHEVSSVIKPIFQYHFSIRRLSRIKCFQKAISMHDQIMFCGRLITEGEEALALGLPLEDLQECFRCASGAYRIQRQVRPAWAGPADGDFQRFRNQAARTSDPVSSAALRETA